MAGEDILLFPQGCRGVAAWCVLSYCWFLFVWKFVQVWCLQLAPHKGNDGLGGEEWWFSVSSSGFPLQMRWKYGRSFHSHTELRRTIGIESDCRHTIEQSTKFQFLPHKKIQNSPQHPMTYLNPIRSDQEPEAAVYKRSRRQQKISGKYNFYKDLK